MPRRLLATLTFLLLSVLATASAAQERRFLGRGRLVTNDAFIGVMDRWQTGSVAASYVFGPAWTGTLPTRPGRMLEFRLHGQVIAPESLRRLRFSDRRYANALSAGLHTHYRLAGAEIAAGGDLTATGPQTGLYRIQDFLHDKLRITGSERARLYEIRNGFYPGVVVEVGRPIDLGGAVHMRPFVEARQGAETLVRGGVDLILGQAERGLTLRDPVTGHRYRTIRAGDRGFSFVAGADYAYVAKSVFLPAPAYDPLERARLRAGIRWEGERLRLFYGATWLSREFAGQREGQVVGSLRIDYRF